MTEGHLSVRGSLTSLKAAAKELGMIVDGLPQFGLAGRPKSSDQLTASSDNPRGSRPDHKRGTHAWTSRAGLHYFERFDFLLLPAFFNAIATACFCGLPALISVLMFELTVL